MSFLSKPHDLSGKIVIVTGASEGIGREIAETLGKVGANVILVARRESLLKEVQHKIIKYGGSASYFSVDLTKSDQISRLIEDVISKFGRIDVLINVAGMGYYDWIEEQTPSELTEQFMTNVVGMLSIISSVVPQMKKQRSGHIINFASYASRIATPPLTIYASTKYAVEGLTDGLRRELSPWNIHVTRVHPSAVKTNFNKKAEQHGGINYPYDKFTGVTKERVAKDILRVLRHPKNAVYIAKWRFLVDAAVAINRHAPWLIDLVFKARVRTLWQTDKRHES